MSQANSDSGSPHPDSPSGSSANPDQSDNAESAADAKEPGQLPADSKVFPSWLNQLSSKSPSSEDQSESEAGGANESEDASAAPESLNEPVRNVSRTMLETDLPAFADLNEGREEPQPVTPPAVPVVEFAPREELPARNVPKTMIETDISKFVANEALEGTAVEQSIETAPPVAIDLNPTSINSQTGSPRPVARTMLENDISKFAADQMLVDETAPPQALEPEVPAQKPHQMRQVPRTMLEQDISQFMDQEDQLGADEAPHYDMYPEADSNPGQAFSPQTASTSQAASDSQTISDSQTASSAQNDATFAGGAEFEQANHTQPNQSYDPGRVQSDVEMAQEPTSRSDSGRQPVARTMLDKDLIFSQLNESMERFEKIAEEKKQAEPVKPFEPIEEFKIASPCPWKWDDPYTTKRVAVCERCSLQVYNFDKMELPEAQRLIYQRENIENAKLFKRADGKFMTRDCPLGAKKKRALPLMVAGITLLFMALLAFCFVLTQVLRGASGSSSTATAPHGNSSSTSPSGSGSSNGSTSSSSSTSGSTASGGSSTSASGSNTNASGSNSSASGSNSYKSGSSTSTGTSNSTEVTQCEATDKGVVWSSNSSRSGNQSSGQGQGAVHWKSGDPIPQSSSGSQGASSSGSHH